MRKILLQAGHQGVTVGATGAPLEMEFNVRVRDALSKLLIDRGFQLFLIGANGTREQLNQDYDLALAIHYDANIYGTGGGFVDYPDPKVDAVNAESKRIRDAIASLYFKETGIAEHNERSNPNTKFYYLWSQLTAKTPCVIIECGVGLDAHDRVILNDTNRVATAIARGICKAFNVSYDIAVTPQDSSGSVSATTGGQTPVFVNTELVELKKKIGAIVNGSWLTYLRSRNAIRELIK